MHCGVQFTMTDTNLSIKSKRLKEYHEDMKIKPRM